MQRESAGPGIPLSSGFILLLIVTFTTRIPALWILYLTMAASLVLVYRRALAQMTPREQVTSIILASILTLMLPWGAGRNEAAIIHYIGCLLTIGSAFILTRNPETYLRASRISL